MATLLSYTPHVRIYGTGSYEPLWPGGVMERNLGYLEASYRLANGTRKTYNTAGGRLVYEFIYSFERMPATWRDRLDHWLWKNKGNPTAAPLSLGLQHRIPDFPADQLTEYKVDFAEPSLQAARAIVSAGRLVGYSGSIRFVQV